jgi:L-alanine-DL-glutamate epimerase-like enolase superfamily enzyme
MKITDVKVTVITAETPFGGPPGRSFANLLQIFTDQGIEGDFLAGGSRAAGRGLAESIVNSAKPMILGKDPLDREAIWDSLVYHGMGGISMNAAGAIDVALWDIGGKAAGVPVYKLLGGYRDKIRAYASLIQHDSPKEYADYAVELAKRGYTAVKLHLRGGPESNIVDCKTVRDAVGPNFTLMLDSNCRYDRREALWVGRELEKLDYYWYEEPLVNTDIEGYIQLSRTLDIPIAATETLYYANPQHFVPYLKEPVADILRTDAERGITLCKKVSDLCDAFNVKCELHGWGFAMCQFANLHVAGACRNSDFFEKMEPGELYDACVKNTVQIDKEGYVHLPTKPGLGVELDFAEIKKRTVFTA